MLASSAVSPFAYEETEARGADESLGVSYIAGGRGSRRHSLFSPPHHASDSRLSSLSECSSVSCLFNPFQVGDVVRDVAAGARTQALLLRSCVTSSTLLNFSVPQGLSPSLSLFFFGGGVCVGVCLCVCVCVSFFSFFCFIGLHSWHVEVLRLGLNQSYSCQPAP